MSEPTSATVECPICGEEFDPTDAGGWCTNPDCGEWQYLGEEVPEPAEGEDPGDAAAAEAESEADEGESEPEIERDLDEPVASAEAAATDDEVAPRGDEAADEAEPEAAGGDAEPVGEDEAETIEEEPEAAAEPVEEEEPPDEPEPAEEEPKAAEPSCPDCGATVHPDDNFCSDCGSELGETAEAALEACPDCGADIDPDDSFCADCGADLEAAREELPAGDEAAEEAAPDSLVLRARGETVAVSEDQTVGREIRRIVTETGGDEDDAVRIHREHVRFVREGGQFYLVDLGDNPTRLNDRRLSKGDRKPVEPGDEIELSGVVTLSVEAP